MDIMRSIKFYFLCFIALLPTWFMSYHYLSKYPFKEYGFGRSLLPIRAEILNTGVTDTRAKGSIRFEPLVSFTYTVDGRKYVSNLMMVDPPRSSKEEALASVNRFKPGDIEIAYYSPTSPNFAVLNPRFPWRWWISISVGTIFIGFLNSTLIFLIMARRQSEAHASAL
jgi:Protein of unknown function (DUF3592)